MFMRVNSKCAHHLRPPPEGSLEEAGFLTSLRSGHTLAF
jgi:hypothetical protein